MAAPKTKLCPVCGKPVPVKAKACHHCGACDKSGWNEEESAADGLDLPDEEFDYEKFKEEEFGQPRPAQGKKLIWKITAIVLFVLVILLGFLGQLFSK